MYIDNQILYDEICKSREQNELTDTAYDLIFMMAQGTIRKMYVPWSPYITKIAISYAIADVEKYMKNFKPEHPNKPDSAYGYFTEIIKRAYANFYLKMKK